MHEPQWSFDHIYEVIITTLKWLIQWLHTAQHTRLASPSPNPTGMSRLHAIPLERLDIGDWRRRWMLEKYRITWRKPKPETLIMSLYISNNQEVLFMLSVQKMRVINQPFHNQYPDTELKTVWTVPAVASFIPGMKLYTLETMSEG